MDFKCPLCAYVSETIILLHVHCVNAHPKEFFTCPWCTLPFSTLRALQKHATECQKLDVNEPREGEVNTVLVNGDKCLVCEGRFTSNEATIKHYKEQHLNFSYICDVCEMYFQHNSNLDKHYAESHPKASTSTNASDPHPPTQAHQRETRSANQTTGDKPSPSKKAAKKCIIRNTSFSYKRLAMISFKAKHCCSCEEDFASVSEIQEHFKVEHKTAVFPCDLCNNAYLQKTSLNSHKKSKHLGQQNAMRNDENERTTPLQNATVNEIQTTNQPSITCPMCPFQTVSPVLFAAHLMGHMSSTVNHQIKSENENEVGVSSTSIYRRQIKKEIDWSKFDADERPEPTDGGFVDLTSDSE